MGIALHYMGTVNIVGARVVTERLLRWLEDQPRS